MRWLEATLAELQANPTHDCVLWPYGKNTSGYGRISINGVDCRVSAVVLERTVGPRPSGMVACHLPIVCHNRLCINTLHLRWATITENNRDRLLDGTMPLGVDHKIAKLSPRDAWEITQLYATGEWTQRQLAVEFGVAHTTIRHVLDGTNWKHIEGVPRPSARDHPPRFT